MSHDILMLIPAVCFIITCVVLFMIFDNYSYSYRVLGFGEKLAIHECGHAMVIVGYHPRPRLTHITIVQSKNRYDGRVHCDFTGIDTSDKEFVELWMFMLLAGKMAEKSCLRLGRTRIVSTEDDLNKWHMLAAQKIDTDNKVMRFFLTKILQYKQEKALKSFFKSNMLVLREMAELLLKEKTLFFYEIEPFLKRINYPKNFPVLPSK